jgi:hypothetical protein
VGRHVVLVCVRALGGCGGGTHDGGVFVGDDPRGVVMLDNERGPVARRNIDERPGHGQVSSKRAGTSEGKCKSSADRKERDYFSTKC